MAVRLVLSQRNTAAYDLRDKPKAPVRYKEDSSSDDECDARPAKRRRKSSATIAANLYDHLPENVREIIIKGEKDVQDHGSAASTQFNYLELLKSLPWNRSVSNVIDLDAAARVLDEDHAGLGDVKERLLEEFAMWGTTPNPRASVLCLVGPPGVGKTSIAVSAARACGRPFVKGALGGVHMESEIRGTPRVYVGAAPGRIIQGLRNVAYDNPVFLLDEMDKPGRDGGNGDVSAALLELLDPEQNQHFGDHYLSIPYDLSKVFFICTANSVEDMSKPLLDRLELIFVGSYGQSEKLHIAKSTVIPKCMRESCISAQSLQWDDKAVHKIIAAYTAEAGVRQMQRHIAAVCRKVAYVRRRGEVVERIDVDILARFLKGAKHATDVCYERDEIGQTHGLDVSSSGVGGIACWQAKLLPQARFLELTGNLLTVCRESALVAYNFLTGVGGPLYEQANRYGVHLHAPNGAPKEGTSGGLAAVACMASCYLGVALDHRIAMTGEVGLGGAVYAVGGVREKLMAAHAAGIQQVILPRDNADDLLTVPKQVLDEMRVTLVKHCEEMLQCALVRA